MYSSEEHGQRMRDNARRRYEADPAGILARMHTNGVPCRGCGRPRYVAKENRAHAAAMGGPLCHQCRRDEKARIEAEESKLRGLLASITPEPPPVLVRKRSGRSGTGHRRYRENRLIVLAASDICGLCGHGGSLTVDHIVSARHWPPGVPGRDDVENLQPAHGTMGSTGAVNRCPTCGLLCNQMRGAKALGRWQTDRAAERAKAFDS